MDDIEAFYIKVVHDLIKDKNASILVCGGNSVDKNVFINLGFLNVIISNIVKIDDNFARSHINLKMQNLSLSLTNHLTT